MAQTIATISLIISIIVLQHLYNWTMRKLYNLDKEVTGGAMFAASCIMFVVTFFLFKLLLEINK